MREKKQMDVSGVSLLLYFTTFLLHFLLFYGTGSDKVDVYYWSLQTGNKYGSKLAYFQYLII